MNLYVQGTKTQTAKIQTFFSGLGSNWPGSDGITPNWYNYYEQAYPSSLVYSSSLTVGGSAHVAGHYDGGNQIDDSIAYIGPWAYNRDRLPVFGVDSQTNQIYTIGELHTDGIYRYLAVVYHELEHISLWQNNDVIIDNADGSVPAGVIDSDKDGIPDAIELQYGLDPEESDTTGYYGDQADTLDEGHQDPECLCDIVALGQVVNKSSAWMVDWADFGVQYGSRKQYFPYKYSPYSSNDSDSNQLPSGALISLP